MWYIESDECVSDEAIAEAGRIKVRTLGQESFCLRGLKQMGHAELQLVRPGSLTCRDWHHPVLVYDSSFTTASWPF